MSTEVVTTNTICLNKWVFYFLLVVAIGGVLTATALWFWPASEEVEDAADNRGEIAKGNYTARNTKQTGEARSTADDSTTKQQ